MVNQVLLAWHRDNMDTVNGMFSLSTLCGGSDFLAYLTLGAVEPFDVNRSLELFGNWNNHK